MDTSDSWEDVRGKGPAKSLGFFNEALTKAPGHCEALAGKAMAMLAMTLNEPELNKFMVKMEESQESETEFYSLKKTQRSSKKTKLSLLHLFHAGRSGKPKGLLKAKQQIESQSADLTVLDVQNLIETVSLPKTDSVITYLEAVIKADSFDYLFNANGRKLQIDKGDLHLFLAGVKFVKAWQVMVVSRNFDDLVYQGSHEWLSSVGNIIDYADFENLSNEDKSTLDRLTSLFKKESQFLSIRPVWVSKYKDIPKLMVSAIENVQNGFRYSISESPADQVNDMYTVGSSPLDDLNPKDLEDAIKDLDRLKRYFKGPVSIPFNNGTRTVTVDITSLFKQTKGPQQFFPYHKILPYKDWVSSKNVSYSRYDYYTGMYVKEYDVERTFTPFEFTDSKGKTTLTIPQMNEIEKSFDLNGKVIFPDPTFGGLFPDLNQSNIWTYFNGLELQENKFACKDGNTTRYYNDKYDAPYGAECKLVHPAANANDLEVLNYWLEKAINNVVDEIENDYDNGEDY